jgi:hypothetical protein
MFLVDTNVWLELLLEQDKADEVRRFLQNVDAVEVAISEFSLYSIGIALCRLSKEELFEDFLNDTFEQSGVTTIRLNPDGLKDVLAVRRQFKLDFDDAYQYVAAMRHSCALVSFDADFDRTERGRKTPLAALEV